MIQHKKRGMQNYSNWKETHWHNESTNTFHQNGQVRESRTAEEPNYAKQALPSVYASQDPFLPLGYGK